MRNRARRANHNLSADFANVLGLDINHIGITRATWSMVAQGLHHLLQVTAHATTNRPHRHGGKQRHKNEGSKDGKCDPTNGLPAERGNRKHDGQKKNSGAVAHGRRLQQPLMTFTTPISRSSHMPAQPCRRQRGKHDGKKQPNPRKELTHPPLLHIVTNQSHGNSYDAFADGRNAPTSRPRARTARMTMSTSFAVPATTFRKIMGVRKSKTRKNRTR